MYLRQRPQLNPLRFYGGLIAGLSFSFVLYQFAILLLSLLDLLALGPYFKLSYSSDEERLFYKLFLAALSLITGTGISTEIWFNKAFSYGKKPFFARSRIFNDHRVLLWSFLHWFLKLAFLYGLLFEMTFMRNDEEIGFYEHYRWLFPLILVVLYLNQWKNLLLVYGRKGFRYLFLSAVIIGFLSLGFSQWSLYDVEKLEAKLALQNPYTRFDIELPNSGQGELNMQDRAFYNEYFFVVNKVDAHDVQVYSSLTKKLLSLEEFHTTLSKDRYFRQHYIPSRYPLRLVFDQGVKLKQFIKVHSILPQIVEREPISLAVRFNQSKAHEHYNIPIIIYGENLRLKETFPALPPPPPGLDSIVKYEYKLEPAYGNMIYCNGELISLSHLERLVAFSNPRPFGCHFNFRSWGEVSYKKFINCLQAIRKGLDRTAESNNRSEKPALKIRFSSSSP
ncbi:MAG: hypothetical protein NXI09_01645 [Bacteroidetes bacterium]|nr:hypothetical protein [Bacteroidota bacterium]